MTTIAQQRINHQRIAYQHFQTPGEVVQWLGALQAQDYASAEWTIGLRMAKASPALIQQAIAEKSIVRTWLLRGTLHIVTAADLRWMLALLAPGLIAHYDRNYRLMGLDDEVRSKSYAALVEALHGGQQLTRKELVTALDGSGVVMNAMQISNLLNRAALDGLICLGVMQGKQQSYTLLDEWLPQHPNLVRDEALSEFAMRYFTSHGPATLHDFAWWTGLAMKDARAGLEAVKTQLVEDKREGKSYWLSPSSIPIAETSHSLYLLPGFDEFVLGYSDRSDLLQAEHYQKITGLNAIFAYTMVWDGQVVGTWKRSFRKGVVEVTFSPFAPLPPEIMQAFATKAQHYGDFYEVRALVSPA